MNYPQSLSLQPLSVGPFVTTGKDKKSPTQ